MFEKEYKVARKYFKKSAAGFKKYLESIGHPVPTAADIYKMQPPNNKPKISKEN